jgi:L-alanine-DL-glutamate epimerase-like enolase superfamily enzyme
VARGKIERIELFHVDVPLGTPFFPVWIPGFPLNQLRSTLLRVTTRDGLVGHATGTAFDREREGVGNYIGPFLLGLDPYDVEAAAERLRQSSILGWSNSWMEIAFWDLAAQKKGVPVWQLVLEQLGKKPKNPPSHVDAYASFGELRPPEARAEALERAARLGFRGAKICVHAHTEQDDIKQIKAARSAVGERFKLMVHAHQSSSVSLVEEVIRWDAARAERFADEANRHGVAWLQDPLLADSLEDLSKLAHRSKVPLAGGDTATTAALLRASASLSCYRVLTPDVSFVGLGGPARLFEQLVAKDIDLSPRSYADGLALIANLHLLVAFSQLSGRPGWLEFPWEPPAIVPEQMDAILSAPIHAGRDGRVEVPTGPGLGVTISPKALRRYATRFYNLTPVLFMVASARRSGLHQTAVVAKPGRTRASKKRASG